MCELPIFKYHPDPVATEEVVRSGAICLCCGQARGYIYIGPVYATESYDGQFRPWCIASGAASLKFDAKFTDAAGIGAHGTWDAISDAVVSEVACRTPGFSGWQQERWWTHCGDAAAYIGRVGRAELEAMGEEAIDVFRAETGFTGDKWIEFFRSLDRNSSVAGYLFKCLHCRALGGYHDYD